MRKRGFLAGLVAGLAALATVLTMASPVMADYPTVDASQAGSLTIENYPVKGAQFRAYEVASFSGGKLVLTDGFRDAKITGLASLDLNDMTSSDWSTLAASLASYEGLASMTPVVSGTDEEGNPTFDFGTGRPDPPRPSPGAPARAPPLKAWQTRGACGQRPSG